MALQLEVVVQEYLLVVALGSLLSHMYSAPLNEDYLVWVEEENDLVTLRKYLLC